MIRLEQFLEGKVESRHEIVARELAGKSTDELRVMLREELKELAELTGGTPEQLDARTGPGEGEMDRKPDRNGPMRSGGGGEAAEDW